MRKQSALALAIASVIAVCAMLCWLIPSSKPKTVLAKPAERARFKEVILGDANVARSGASPTEPADRTATNARGTPRETISPRLQRLLSGDPVRGKISREVIDSFLDERGRSALSLLVAWQESGNDELLREAAERHPDDPQVQIAMLSTELSAEERMQWIERFKKSAPDNALADYYAAVEFFQRQDATSAIAALRAGTGKSQYEDYMIDQMRERESLFRAAGLPGAEARVQAMFGTTMPFLRALSKVRQELPPEITARLSAGDVQGAIDLGSMGMTMAGQMKTGSSSHVILNELVSMAIERSMIESLGPAAADQLLAASSADRLAEIARRRDEIRELTRTIDPATQNISPAQLTQYLQIMLDSGELQALQWLKAQRE
jgi:hypothetical protein